MSWIAFHFSGGDAFFSGSTLILAACAAAIFPQETPIGRWKTRLLAAGALVVALSATPLPIGIYAGWGALALAWLIAQSRAKPAGSRQLAVTFNVFLISVTLGVVAWELSYRFPRRLQTSGHTRLAIIGDSISAGMLGPEEHTWPKQLQENFSASVVDVSMAGATARSASRQAERIPDDATLILIEIGGNDVLGSTTPKEFETDLEALLKLLRKPGRQLVMLELPLPPFYNSFGRSQRVLASRYDVALISKREFAAIISTTGATLDGLHLSEEGHRRMAKMVWSHVGDSLMSQHAEN